MAGNIKPAVRDCFAALWVYRGVNGGFRYLIPFVTTVSVWRKGFGEGM